MGFRRFATAALISVLVAQSGSVLGQDDSNAASSVPVQTQNEGLSQAGRTADTGAGEVGQRQTARDIARNTAPLQRLDSRIQTRIENRIRNRIDRDYDPRANATSPFQVADRKRRATRRPR